MANNKIQYCTNSDHKKAGNESRCMDTTEVIYIVPEIIL
eukprot:SAG11_NODE_17530_length_515_cov_3.382212_1_plen_38_part_01